MTLRYGDSRLGYDGANYQSAQRHVPEHRNTLKRHPEHLRRGAWRHTMCSVCSNKAVLRSVNIGNAVERLCLRFRHVQTRSDTFPNESERKDEATWIGSTVSCSLPLHQLKGYLLSNDISWQVKATKVKWLWHTLSTVTHTVTLPGFKPRTSLTWQRATGEETPFNKEEVRKITKGVTVIQSRFKLGTSLINPSAWGHLNPSSYCDVGSFLWGI